MYHRVRKKMFHFFGAIVILSFPLSLSKSIVTTTTAVPSNDHEVNDNIIDFDEEYTLKFNKKYGMVPWHADFDKNSLKYTIVKDTNKSNKSIERDNPENNKDTNHSEESTTEDFRVIPLELITTTDDPLFSLIESTTEQDLTVIPLSTTEKIQVTIDETVTLPTTNSYPSDFDNNTEHNSEEITSKANTEQINEVTTSKEIKLNENTSIKPDKLKRNVTNKDNAPQSELHKTKLNNQDIIQELNKTIKRDQNIAKVINNTFKLEQIKLENQNITNSTTQKPKSIDLESKEEDVPIFTELDTEDIEDIPEDYYDSKDVVPTSAPKTDALSVLFGLAGSVVESVVETVAERVVPKSIYDLFKRMQKQSEALEAERLRSREENGGLGQFGRGILKTISTGLAKPLTQIMEPKENGSLDTDRGFVASVASSVSSVANVANSVVDAFKDKVQAIYPGTVWCGDGHSAQARSSDLGLFFFTDTCCRQHDACKIYISSGESKYGLTNTGLFTRSHCSCDTKFRECLQRTNSLVSAQIGLTYFNVLGPQCFRRAHPIVKCLRKTRITGLKCEEYELDYTKPKMWQWFDNETF